MNKEVVGGIIGTSVSAVGTGTQTNDVLQTISLVLTITGAVITIIMAIVNWWKNAHADGKIDAKEVGEVAQIIKDGVDSVKDIVDKNIEKEDEEK